MKNIPFLFFATLLVGANAVAKVVDCQARVQASSGQILSTEPLTFDIFSYLADTHDVTPVRPGFFQLDWTRGEGTIDMRTADLQTELRLNMRRTSFAHEWKEVSLFEFHLVDLKTQKSRIWQFTEDELASNPSVQIAIDAPIYASRTFKLNCSSSQ